MADSPTDHFFKFIRPGFLFNLSIPKSFMKNLNGKRCFKAIPRRGGHEWSVEIADGVFGGDGWRRFVSENGVQELDIIVFQHEGGMMFEFFVYDHSTSCERDYPNLFDEEMEGEEHPTEADTIRTHSTQSGPKKLKKRKRNDIYASEDGEKFQGDDSGCFKSKMTPYVINKSRLHVPMKFAKSNGLITQKIYTQVYLMDDRQRSWPATLQKGKLELCLTGWHDFRVKNHLKVGDVCRFELVKHGEVPLFKCSNMRKVFVKNHIQVKETSSSLNSHPYFISNLQPTTFNRWVLYLPVHFAISNGLKTGEMILKDNKGRSWNVNLRKLKENQFYITGPGFRDFLVANGMKEGDAFKLELVEKVKDKPPIVNFFFLKSKPIKSHTEAKFTRKEGAILFEEDGCPYFVGELKSCSIKQSILYLPIGFAKSSGLINNKTMTLKNVEDGRSWTVELKNHKEKFYYIGEGWKDFRVANGLKEGDHFKFVLVKKGAKPILNFYLQKSVEATRLPSQNKIKKVLEKSISIDHQPPPPNPTKDTWSKKEVKKQMGKMRDKMYEHFNAALLLLQEQQAQFIRSHSSNYQPSPQIQINCYPKQFLDDESDD